MSAYEAREKNIRGIAAMLNGCGPTDFAERERLLWNLVGIHAGALTPVSEDEKLGMERVLAILDRKLGEGGGLVGPEGSKEVENHNRFFRGRESAFAECAMMLRAALRAAEQVKS